MASGFEGDEAVTHLLQRRDRDLNWSCDKHNKPIKFFCEPHKISVCLLCALRDHQKPCELKDIEDVIKELRYKVTDITDRSAHAKIELNNYDEKLSTCRAVVGRYLESLKKEINKACTNRIDKEIETDETRIRQINQQADEEIRIINEKRQSVLKKIREDAEQRLSSIKEMEYVLFHDVELITDNVQEKFAEIMKESEAVYQTLHDGTLKLERLLREEKELVDHAHLVIESQEKTLQLCVKGCVVDNITDSVKRIRFMQGGEDQEFIGRIDGFIGKWELVDTLGIPSGLQGPRVVGCMGGDKIGISDFKLTHLHVVHMTSNEFGKAIEGEDASCIISCGSLNGNEIVCGKWNRACTGASLDGNISLYDRQYQRIRNLTIKRNTLSRTAKVCVDVDKEGKILAAEIYQPTLYVIEPSSGEIVDTIIMKGNKTVAGAIYALSSGDIVVRTGGKEFTVISRAGDLKVTMSYNEWGVALCRVDSLTDTLYITNWNRERNVYTVDAISSNGTVQAKEIVEFPRSDRSPYMSPSIITPSGRLISCDGGKILVYRKTFVI